MKKTLKLAPVALLLAAPAAGAAGDPVIKFHSWFYSPNYSSSASGNVPANGPNGPYTSKFESKSESSHRVFGGQISMEVPIDNIQTLSLWARAGAAEGEVVAANRGSADPAMGGGWLFAGAGIAKIQSKHVSAGVDWTREFDTKVPLQVTAGLGLGYTREARNDIDILYQQTFVYPVQVASGVGVGVNLRSRFDLSRQTNGRISSADLWLEKAPWRISAEEDHMASPLEVGAGVEIPFSSYPFTAGTWFVSGINGKARLEMAAILPDDSLSYKNGLRLGAEVSVGPASVRVDHISGLTTQDDFSSAPEGNYGFGHGLAAFQPGKPWFSYLPGTHLKLSLSTKNLGEFAISCAFKQANGSLQLAPGLDLPASVKERMIGVSWKMQF